MFAIDNYDFKGKRAIIRVDFNVPLNEKGEVTDDTRIRAAIPTIKKVLEKGGSVILMSHLGRPKKNPDPKFSLEQIVPAIEKRLGVKVMFAGDCMGEKAAEMAANLKPGEVMLLENLRFYAEEEGSAPLAKPKEGGAGGKTASAQTGQYDEEGEEIVHAWFSGFFPAQQPKYAVVILIEGGEFGGQVASPLFQQIADTYGPVGE